MLKSGIKNVLIEYLLVRQCIWFYRSHLAFGWTVWGSVCWLRELAMFFCLLVCRCFSSKLDFFQSNLTMMQHSLQHMIVLDWNTMQQQKRHCHACEGHVMDRFSKGHLIGWIASVTLIQNMELNNLCLICNEQWVIYHCVSNVYRYFCSTNSWYFCNE